MGCLMIFSVQYSFSIYVIRYLESVRDFIEDNLGFETVRGAGPGVKVITDLLARLEDFM